MKLRQPVRASALALLLVLGGCSILESKSPREQLYALRPATASGGVLAAPGIPGPRPASGAAAVSLQVLRPASQPGLETQRIVLMRPDGRLDYYAGGRWAGALPNVVAALLSDSLRTSGDYADVQDERSGFSGDYVLGITLRHFQAEYGAAGPDAQGVPQAHVALDCTLAGRGNRRVMLAFRAEAHVPADEARLGAVVAALERAAQDVTAQVRTRVTAALNEMQAKPAPSVEQLLATPPRTSTAPSTP